MDRELVEEMLINCLIIREHTGVVARVYLPVGR